MVPFLSNVTTKHKMYYGLLTFSILSTIIINGVRFFFDSNMSLLNLEKEPFLQNVNTLEIIFIGLPILISYFILYNLLKNESVLNIASLLFFITVYIFIWGAISHFASNFLFTSYNNELIHLFINFNVSLLAFIIFSILLYRLFNGDQKKTYS